MPTEQTICPECSEPIGGENHRAVDGVNHAIDLEGLLFQE